MPGEILPNGAEQLGDGQLVSEIVGSYQMMHKDNDGNAVVTTLYKQSTKKRPGTTLQPIIPRQIRPDRRKPISRDYKTLFVFGDAQIGYRRIED